METGEWKLGSKNWGVKTGEWKLGSGDWRVETENYTIPVVSITIFSNIYINLNFRENQMEKKFMRRREESPRSIFIYQIDFQFIFVKKVKSFLFPFKVNKNLILLK